MTVIPSEIIDGLRNSQARVTPRITARIARNAGARPREKYRRVPDRRKERDSP